MKPGAMKDSPKILSERLLFTVLTGFGCFVVGIVYYTVAADGIALMLSLALLFCSLARAADLYVVAAKKKYATLEGACVGRKEKPFRKSVTVRIAAGDGEITFRVEKSAKIEIGAKYRFCIRSGESGPDGDVIGFEKIGEPGDAGEDCRH
jgi:hypothetical protein